MKKIILLIALFTVFALMLVSCDTSLNDVADGDDQQNEENIGGETESSTSDTDTESDSENNTDDNSNTNSDENKDSEVSSDDNDSSDQSGASGDDETSNQGGSSSEDSSSSGDSSSSEGGSSGDSSSSSGSEGSTEEWVEPTVELQDPITAGDYQLALNAEGTEYTIVKYLGEAKDLEVISEHEGIPVTRIARDAFAGNYYIVSISIPSPIRTIEISAFNSCNDLVSVELPNTLIYLDPQAFIYSDDIESLTIAEGNPRYHSADNCIIETATKTLIKGCFNSVIPADGSVEIIVGTAFWGLDNMQNLTIPKCIKEIGYHAFYVCSSSLESITVEEGNPRYHSAGNCLIETATKTLLLGCSNSVIPTDGSVEIIDSLSFYGSEQLKSVHIPASVKTLRHAPFANCSGIESLTVEEGNPVYSSAGNCVIETATKTIILTCNNSVIPDDGSVTKLSSSAFDGRGITSIEIPSCITEIGSSCFSSCDSLTDIVIPDGITRIERSMFSFCGELKSVTLPASVTFIGDMAFGYCGSYGEKVTIKFKGTEEEWNAIEKVDEWDIDTEITVLFNQ